MDINSRDPSQNIIPFRIKGIEAARFDQSGNLGIGTQTPTDKLQVIGNVSITGSTTMIGTTTIAGNLNLSTNSETSALNNINPAITINGRIIEDKTTTIINMDSQVSATALNKQKKQSIPLREPSILKTSDVVSKMSGVSVGKSQVYGIGPSQTASYGNIIVAVGGGVGTNSIAYSTANPPTPSSWVGIPLSASTYTTSGNSIAYANGTWVTVGDGTNSIVYSTVTPPIASSWVKIPINNTVNVVSNTFTVKGHVVTYANGYWVAGGEGTNCMCYSNANPPTAESWIGIPTSARTFTNSVRSISYANGTWVAVGDGTNAIAYSTRTPPVDESWVPIALARTNETGGANITSSIAISITYANGTWLVGGGTNIPLLYSIENPPISTSWMPITIEPNTSQLNQFGSNATCVGYGNGVWVACGNSNDIMAYSTATIPHSSSWITLKGPTTTPSTKTIKSITYNPSTNTWFFCGGWSNNCLFYSTQTPPLPASWIAVSSGSNTFGTNANALISTTTNAFTSPVNVSRLDNKFTFPANRIIAVGGGNNDNGSQAYSSRYTNNTIVYSDDDGATWLMVPGGANNYMFSSEDGTNDAGIGLGGSKGANAVAWNGERWIAAGNGRTHSLAFSDDGGMTWTGITGKSIFSVEARSIAWNGKMWVAVGRGVNCSTAYSYDGLTWMATVDPSGNRVNIFSYEGPVNNSGNSLSGMSDIYGGGNKVIWNGKFWIATGTRTRDTETNSSYTIAISYDGKTWRKISGENAGSASTANGFDVYAYGVEWNGRYFIATGRGSVNTLAYSTDCISWYGLGKTVFTNWGRGITWGARKWVATGSGRNTIAYSSDGRTWTGCGNKVFNPIRRFMSFGDIATFTNTHNGAPQRGVAISYSDDGITWDAPIINQNLEFRNPRRVLPNAFYVRTGTSTSSWRDFIPLLTANSTTSVQTWSADAQFYDVNNAPQNEIAQQFSYFAGYWLNANRAMNGDSFAIAYYSPNNNGNFTFTATSNYPVTSYTGSLSSLNSNATYTLTPQPDGIAAGIAAQFDTFSTILTTNQTIITNAITDNTKQHSALMYSTDAGGSWSRIPGSSDASSTGGTDMTPANQGCLSISMNPARTRFLISGGDSAIATRKVYFSNDGFNWRNGVNSPNQTSQMAWVYASLWIGGSHNRWLIGGNDAAINANGRIMYSSDVDALTAWSTTSTSPSTFTNSQIICFASNTSFSVILAGSTLFNTIYKSTNGGANWSTISISSSIGSVLSIAYSPSLLRWVAVGGSSNTASNTIIYSDDDGVNWSASSLQAKNAATSLFKTGSVVTKVIWDIISGRFIIGGFNGGNTTFSMAYSSDGINWTPVSIEEPRQSNDASLITTTIGPFFSRCREIMAVDISGEYTQINTGYSVLWNSYANRFIAVGNGTTPIVVSNDGGVTWSTSSQQSQQQAIAVVCGKSGANSRATVSPISYTVDGVTWLQSIGAKGIFPDPGDVRCAKYGETSKSISPNGRLWVAGGTGNSTYSLAFSQNGIRWSGITNSKSLIGDVRTIAYAPSDISGATTTSNNGIGNGVWVAGGVGGSGTSSIVFSYDGVSWNEVPKSTSILNICNACTYANGMFVAGGEGALYIGNPSTIVTPGAGYDGINYLNRIFMLYVTGTKTGEIWGTDIYTSDSVIGKAAVHSGIVADGESKMVFIQRVNSNFYMRTTRNGITSNSYTYYPGYIFLPSTSPICTSLFAYSFDGINWKNIPYTTNQVNGSIKSITYGKDENGKGIWVAGAEHRTLPTNPNVSILYSYNGIDWTPIVNSGSLSTSVNSIAYGMNSATGLRMWIAAVYNSSGYSFIQSSNGRDWSSIPNTKTGLFDNTSFGATSISYLNGVWYATGICTSSGKSVAYSYDGTYWNGVYQYSNMYGISGERIQTYDNSMYAVATVNDITIPAKLSTIRGIAWTSGLGSCYIQHPTIAFGTERVGVSNPRSFRNITTISPDGGRTWTSTITNSQHLFPEIGGTDIGNTAFNGGVCNDAVWNGMIWVAVGLGSNGSKVATSKDGIQWTQIPVANVPIDGVINTIVWNGKIWMIGGDGRSTNPPSPTANEFSIATSVDAINWTGIPQTDNKVSNVKKIAWNGNYWTAVGSGTVSKIMVSINGVNWETTINASDTSNETSSNTLIENVNDVVWGGNRWIAVGSPRINDASNNFTILYSADTPAITTPTVQPAEYAYTGKKWRGVPGSSNLFPFGVKSVCWNGKRFIATGPAYSLTSAGNVIAWSSDGIKWTAYSSRKTFARGQRWVAVGSGNRATIATSADGKNWNEIYESSKLFPDISSNSLSPGARAIGWNGTSLTVGGSGGVMDKTSVPVYAFIGSGGNNPILPTPSGTPYSTYKISTSVFVSYLDSSRNWLNTYTDLSMTNLFQVTSQQQQFSSAIKWNGYAWVAHFGLTSLDPSGIPYGNIWFTTDPLARAGWSVASNYATPKLLTGQGGYAALEWNGIAWLACGYDVNNNNLIYTTDRFGASGWTAVSGIVSGSSSNFQPVCIGSSSRYWVVGGNNAIVTTINQSSSAIYFTSDRTGASGWKMVNNSVLPGIRITSIGYNGAAWLCCGGISSNSAISYKLVDSGNDNIETGWVAATGNFPSNMENCSAISYNSSASTWVVVGDVSLNYNQMISYTTVVNGSTSWTRSNGLLDINYTKLNGLIWNGYQWIASCGYGAGFIGCSSFANGSSGWNTTVSSTSLNNLLASPSECTNAVAFARIPLSLLTSGMNTIYGVGTGRGLHERANTGRAQGLIGNDTSSVIARSSNGSEATIWSSTYSKNFMIAVGGGIIRDNKNTGGYNRMSYSYDGGNTWISNNSLALSGYENNTIGSIRTVKYGNGIWVAGGDINAVSRNILAYSRDGVNWVGAGGTQIFGTGGACYSVCCDDRGRWVAVGGAALTTAGTYSNTSGSNYTMAWSDDGMNWTPILGSRALFGIVVQGVSYGADASGARIWTAIGRGVDYTGVAYSYDGKNWILSQSSLSLFGRSVNVLTERYAPMANASWRSIYISSTGQYQSACVEGGFIYTSSDYGVSWTQKESSRSWSSISVSSTGQYQRAVVGNGVLGNIYISSDYGVTWMASPVGFGVNWNSISVSTTGQYQSACVYNGNIFTSSNYGVHWVSRDSTRNWISISVSSTGQYQSAVVGFGSGVGGNIYISSDYGVTWRSDGGSAQNWTSISVSSTGQYQSACVYNGYIYNSSNYGVNWSQPRDSVRNWGSISVSSTGQYQSAVVNVTPGNTIYTSSDYGVNWTSRESARYWKSISVSSTGQYQSAVVSGGNIFISSDFGVTWSESNSDSRSLGITYGKNASGVGMWVTTAGRRDRTVSAGLANTMAYSYDGKLWSGITASAGLSDQAWTVAYGNDGFGVGMWVAGGYDAVCGLKWSYDGITWSAALGTGAHGWASYAVARRVTSVYWNGTLWYASTSAINNGEDTTGATSGASAGYLLYSYNGKNWLPVLSNAINAFNNTNTRNAYTILPNSCILDFGSFYDDQTQRGEVIAKMNSKTIGSSYSSIPTKNVNTIIPYGRGTRATKGNVSFLLGGDSGLEDYQIISSTSNAYDNFISGPTAQSTNNQWLYFDVNQDRTVAVLLSQWDTGGNPVILGHAQWDNGLNDTGDYPFIQKITGSGTTTANIGGYTFTLPALVLHPSNSNNNNIGLAYKNITTDTINVIIDIKLSLLFPNVSGDGIEYHIQRGLVGSPRYRIYANSIILKDSSAIHSFNDTVELKSGELVYLILNRRNGYGYDHTRVEFNVNIVYNNIVQQLYYNNPITSELSRSTTSLSVSTDGGVSWRAVPNSTNIMSKVNKLVCDETTGQIVAVGTGNYSLATSTITTCDASNGWTGVFGSRMTNTRPGLFDYYGTDVTWFEGAKMWIATGRTKTRNSSTLAVSVNGTVWLDAKIVTKVNASSADEGQGGGMINLTTNSVNQSSVATTRAIIPYTSATRPLITYTNSAVAFSTQVSSVAVNSQYNRAIIGGSSVQFVAGGGSGSGGSNNGGLAYSYDGLNWSASPSTTGTIFQTPTNVITTSGTNSFDSSFGTVALAQRLFATTYTGATTWISVSLSSTGQYQTAVANNGLLWTSYDYGVTWTSRLDSTNRLWYSVSVSSTGQYQSACVSNVTTGYIWTSSDYGLSWTSRESSRYWISISVSGTGQYQTASVQSGQMYTSSNYGINWTPRSGAGTSMPSWGVSISSSGQYQTVVQNGSPAIWISSDFGVTWISRSEVNQSKMISVSSTGQYQTTVPWSGLIWTSSNFGLNWTSRTTAFGNLELRGVSVSSSGQYQTVVGGSNENVIGVTGQKGGGGPILRSSDFGETWTMLSQYIANWNYVSVSSSGQYQTAVSSGPGDIWTSYDFGVTWVQRSTNTRITDFTHIKSSSSGQYQIATSGRAGNFNGQFYISSNYGQTWLPRNNLASWLGCAVSGTGATMITASASASTLTSRNTFPSFNTLAPTFNGAADYIDLGIPTWTYSTQFRQTMTLECWFKTTDTNNQKPSANLISRWATGGSNAQFMLFMNVNGQIGWYGTLGILSPLSYKDTQWHHAAITYNSASGVGILYIDGVFVTTATNSSLLQLDNNTNLKLAIGNDHAAVVAPANTDRQFRGAISDVRIWDVVRTPSQILDNYRYRLNGNESRLVGYWKLDPSTATGYPGSITNFIDSSPNQVTSIGIRFDGGVTWTNTNTNITSSLYDVTAPTFDGVDDYVNLGIPPWANESQFRNTMTVECWFKTTNASAQPLAFPSLVSRNSGGGTSTYSQFHMGMSGTAVSDDNGKVFFGVTSGSSNTGLYANSSPTKYNDGKWHHIAGTYISSTGTVSLYVDGVLVKTASNVNIGATSISHYKNIPIMIGSDAGQLPDDNATNRTFQGSISDVRIWNVVRTPSQISENYRYQLNGNEEGLMGYWKLNQSNATGYPVAVTQFTDSTTPQDNSTGIFFQNVWSYNTKLSVKPKNQLSILRSRDYGNTFDTISTRNALNFDGIDDYIELGDNITELAAGDFTIECWIKTSQVSAPIFSCINSNTTWDAGERHMYLNASGRPTFVGYGNSFINSTQNVSDNNWHHIAIVWDYSGSGSSGTKNVYIDGQDRTDTTSNYNASTLGFVGTFKIGIPNNSETFSYFNGSIAEFRIWKVARSATEILKNYNIPLTGMEPGLVTYLRLDQGHPEGINTNINYAENNMPYGGYSGILLNFALTGSTSNWVSGFNNKFKKFDYGQFSSFSMTKLGDIQTAVVNGGTIYRSTDYGNTWDISANIDVINVTYSELSSFPSESLGWKSVAISSDANYQTGVVSGGQIYVNSNYGRESWLKVESSRTWTYVAISSDGKYQSALESTNGKIYLNSTFGKGTWTDSSHNNANKAWSGIAMSSNGRYQAATTSGSGKIFVNSNYGLGAWSQTEASIARNWFGVAISSSGQYQTAIVRDGRIYIDSSYGSIATWSTATQPSVDKSWQAIAMSGSGQYQTAVVGNNGRIYVNSNYGNSDWTEITTVPTQDWVSVAISSSTGQYQTAAGKGGFIYINSNYGLGTWTQVNSSRNWISVAVSANGKYQTAVVDSGYIYFSRNYGATWSTTAGVDYLGNNWTDVAVSSETGLYQIACVDGGYLYRSTNTGSTWTSTTVSIDGSAQSDNRVWKAVAISANGEFGLACVNSTTTFGRLYRTIDYGATWASLSITVSGSAQTTSTNRVWVDVGMSANGKYQVACTGGSSGNIYYSKNYGVDWTVLTAAGTRAWSSISLSENCSTITATTNDSSGGIFSYTMPDDQYYRPLSLINTGSTVSSTVRAIAYGNSGTGAATDGYWLAGADASGHTLAYSYNGIDWLPVSGSKTALFNAVNGIAYGADLSGVYMWVAVGVPFIGSVYGTNAFSIAYSYDMINWTGVLNRENFTGQGNRVTYGKDENGRGMWVAVGKSDGSLFSNVGASIGYGINNTTVFYSYNGVDWCAAQGSGIFVLEGNDISWGVDEGGVSTWVATGVGYTNVNNGAYITGGQIAYSTNGRVWIAANTPTTPPFTNAGLSVFYGRGGSQGAGNARWIVGGNGGNVFWYSSRPSSASTSVWTSLASNSAFAPFQICSSICYSNGVWIATNNTGNTNTIARSTNGGDTWSAVSLSSVSSYMNGCVDVAANSYCGFSLAYADFEADTNLRSWVSIEGTKNFLFDGGVTTVATVSSNINPSTYNTNNVWWVAGGIDASNTGVIGYTTDPSGATGWTKAITSVISQGSVINHIAFSPHTQTWLAVGKGTSPVALYSDLTGKMWTSSSGTSYSNSLNTCIWNQPVSSASSSGRWIAGGLTTSGGSSAASLFISTDVSGDNFTPIEGTGAILSEVYSLAFNGRVWIAAGVPNPNVAAQSQCCMMRTFDISGVSNWVSILGTKTNGTSPNNGDGGFDASVRSITWNSQQNMWIATGENSGIADVSSSIMYSLDISGSPGSWRSVRDSNSLFSNQGNGVAFTGTKWIAAGEGTNTIISTSGTNASIANSWSGIPSASNLLSTRATDIAYTGTSIVATGQGSLYTGIVSSDASGTSWVGKNLGFETTPQVSSATSVFYEPSNSGGVLIATGKSTSNSISYSTDYGANWTGSTNSQQLFTNGGNSVEYIGNDTLFVGGGNNVYWNGKRWISVGNIIDRSNEVVSGKLELDAMSGSTIAISDDGIMWSDVPSEFTEGRFVLSNPRIGAAPLIDSQIVISDGCDTELTSDNGSNSYSSLIASSANASANGMGVGIAQIDIISENPIIPSAASAISNGNQVDILGVGINANGTGIAATPGFDNTAFSITVRPSQ